MADTTPQEKRFLELANRIASSNIDQLTKPPNAGPFNFASARQLLESIVAFYQEAASVRYTHTPAPVLDGMAGGADGVIAMLGRIQGFDSNSSNPGRGVENVVGDLGTSWATAYNYAVPHVALARASGQGMFRLMEEFQSQIRNGLTESQKTVGDSVRKVDAAESALKSGIGELNIAMAAAREAAKFEAVTAQSKAFDDEAKEARTTSWIWLGATVVVVCVSLWFVWFVFLKDLHPALADALSVAKVKGTNAPSGTATNAVSAISATETPSESKFITAALLQQTIARILVVTLLYSAVVWCARNYFASCHNYIVNRHRRNAMNTFRAFVQGTDDKATQDFILRQAAACAFSPQQSGYLKDESLPTPGPATQLVDIIKPEGKKE